MKLLQLFIGAAVYLMIHTVIAAPIQIIAAENFYGDIAVQIGGSYVQVTSIMNNPNQDPHLFSVSPATAIALSKADIVIYNGLNYDPWLPKLLSSNATTPKVIIIVANLIHKQMGDNPHIWYNPKTMPAYAAALTQALIMLDPKHADYYQTNLETFLKKYQIVSALIAKMQQQFQGTPVIATEPVFGYMAEALGLTMYGNRFQIRIMNDTEPSVKDIMDFEKKLTHREVKVLIYNKQVSDTLTDRMKQLAQQHGIALVGVTETQPINTNYIDWMVSQLKALQLALSK